MKKNDGFILRLIFSLFFIVFGVVMLALYFIIPSMHNQENLIGTLVYVLLGAIFVACSFWGKKSKAGNIILMIFSIYLAMVGIGVIGIIGCVKGNRYLNEHKVVKEVKEVKEEDNAIKEEFIGENNSVGKEKVVANLKQVEVENKTENKQEYKNATIAMIVIYSVIAIIAILGLTKVLGPVCSSMFYKNDVENMAGNALSVMLGWMFISFIPSIIYYFSINKSYELAKKNRVILFIGGLVASLILIVVFFIVYNDKGISYESKSVSYYEIINAVDGSAWEQTFTLIVSHVGLLLTYLFTLIKINKAKLETKLNNKVEYEDTDSENRFGALVSKLLRNLFRFVGNLANKLLSLVLKLKDKSKALYFVIFTLMFTILSFFISFIIVFVVALLALSLIMLHFANVLSLGAYETRNVYEVYDGVATRTLVYESYFDGKERYIDDLGYYWITEDNGNTFYKE